MSALNDFFDLAIIAGRNLDTLSKEMTAFGNNLAALQKEDPCTTTFLEKLDQLDAEGEKINNFAETVVRPSYSAAIAAYNNLGPIDRRNPNAAQAVNVLNNNIKATKNYIDNIKKAGSRQDLRERYNSCEELKDPPEKDSEEDIPDDDPDREGDNESEDDSGEQDNNTTDDRDNSSQNDTSNSDLGTTGPPNSGTTTAGKSGTPAGKSGTEKPTVRPNPLSLFSSYTYQLSLYMVTPDAYNAWEVSGRKNIKDLVIGKTTTSSSSTQLKGGAYLILQSGGINNKSVPRAPGFELDYYIEDLKIKNLIAPSTTGATTVQTTLSFQVVEPYGFSFLNKLKIASDAIAEYSQTLNQKSQTNPSRQFFVIGIRFQGYNSVGEVLTGKELINGSLTNTTGSGDGVYETYYGINLTKVNFKIDGKTTVYNINAVSIAPNTSFTLKRGRFNKNVSLEATTVEEALLGTNGLVEQLNAYEKSLGVEIPNQYKFEFIGDMEDFKKATIVLKSDVDKLKYPWSPAKNTDEVNEVTAAKAFPNSAKRTISIFEGSSVIQAVEKIVTQSSYLTNALKLVYDSVKEPDEDKADYDETPSDSPKQKIKWYNLSSKVKILGYDTKMNEYSYEITYVISPYETPVLLNAYSNNAQKYYGPVKRYEYWFTGKNTEVINYEQTNNNGYFIVALDPGNSNKAVVPSGNAAVPLVAGMPQPNADVQGKTGVGMQAQGAYLTNLFDPKSYSAAKITILGDPDFLMHDSFTDKASSVYKQFYELDDKTINPMGGQVFIELNFKEAVDYENNTGLLDINDQIVFWQYPESIKKLVNGVSFWVKSVESVFSKGKFTQELQCSINVFSGDVKTDAKVANRNGNANDQRENTNAGNNDSGPNQSATGTTTNNGLLEEPAEQDRTVPVTEPPESTPTDSENESSTASSTVEEGGREE